MNKLYHLPLQFDKLMERENELPTCKLGVSIAQNIFLIVSSKFEEHRFSSDYGCEVWSKDFELITNPLVWQEEVNKSITKALQKYEPRLERIDIDTTITEHPHENPVTKVKSVKKRISIRVSGTIRATGEEFSYTPKLFLSPISLD